MGVYPVSLVSSPQGRESVDHAGAFDLAIERLLKDKHLQATRNSARVNHLVYRLDGFLIKGGTDIRQSGFRFNSWRERKLRGK